MTNGGQTLSTEGREASPDEPAASPLPAAASHAPFELGSAGPAGRIDDLVFAKIRSLGLSPSPTCSDPIFVRRVFLDLIGALPEPAEVVAFLADRSPDKRAALIDRLLGRAQFADYWALHWGDVLRIKSEFPIDLWPLAAQAYHDWVCACIRRNMPYDEFARALLTASGSNFRDPQVNFYRAVPGRSPAEIAKAVARVFMGARIESWPAQRQKELARFFSRIAYHETGEWKEEMVTFDLASVPQTALAAPDGARIAVAPGDDPRARFCDWLVRPGNEWFETNIVNRIWFWLMGRGIIEEPDDIRPDNPPQNQALLDCLRSELVAAKYDLKHICRLIAGSQTYQLSALGGDSDTAAAANFARYPIRRLDAEVLIDAIDQVTGCKETYSSKAPEPYEWIPEDQRTVALADGGVSSPLLEMFGRPARDTGLESERGNRVTSSQRLHMLNSTHIGLFGQGQGSGPCVVARQQDAPSEPDVPV